MTVVILPAYKTTTYVYTVYKYIPQCKGDLYSNTDGWRYMGLVLNTHGVIATIWQLCLVTPESNNPWYHQRLMDLFVGYWCLDLDRDTFLTQVS